jgi:hypothetical protein
LIAAAGSGQKSQFWVLRSDLNSYELNTILDENLHLLRTVSVTGSLRPTGVENCTPFDNEISKAVLVSERECNSITECVQKIVFSPVVLVVPFDVARFARTPICNCV